MRMSNEQIVTRLLDRTHNYLKSHIDMALSSSFRIYAKVLSREHSEAMKNKKVGAGGAATGAIAKDWLLYSPLGYMSQEEGSKTSFLGQCAVISVALASAHNRKALLQPTKYTRAKMRKFVRGENRVLRSASAGHWLKSEINAFLKSEGIARDEHGYNVDLVNNSLARYFNCQIHVFNVDRTHLLTKSFPPAYNKSMEQVHLLESEDNGGFHYDAILNVDSFFNYAMRRICFDCGTIVKSKQSNFRHVCQVRRHCLACRRPILEETTWFLPKDKVKYCDKSETSFGTCTKCNLSFLSPDCERNHRKSECNRGVTCTICKKYLFVSGGRKTKVEVLRDHKCGEKHCRGCFTFTTDSNHVCPIKHQSPQRDWNKMCFLSFGFLTKETEGGQKEFCPKQACLIYEADSPGTFRSKWFEKNEKTCNGPTFFEQYWPESVTRTLNNDGRRIHFGKISKNVLFKQFQRQKDRSLAGEVLKHMLTNDGFRNSTVVAQSSEELLAICGALVDEQLYPTVLRRDNMILEIVLKEANIRFVDFNNFKGPVSKLDLCKKMGVENENIFYPHNLGYENAIDDPISPEYSLFEDFNDTSEIIKAKLDYVAYLHTCFPYLLGDQGKNFTLNTATSLAKYCLAYVRECFTMQEEAGIHLGKPPVRVGEMEYLHPISTPFVSNGSFVYGVFRFFYLNNQDIQCIPHEHTGLSNDKVSKGEAQWMYYLQDPEVRAFHNHRNGQNRNFQHLIPDGYDEREGVAYFYNGCFYHNHSKDGCLSSRPMLKKLRGESEDFAARLEKFHLKYPEIRVKIMWECEWARLKKNNPDIAQWFQDHPWADQPPLTRLIPREALRGGHAESYRFFWDRKDHPDEELIYADLISQYPDIALSESFPVGKFDVIIGEDLNSLDYSDGHLSWREADVNGLVFLSIEAPRNMEYPFILYRTKDNRSVAALCSKCAEDQVLTACPHEGMDRAITGVYTTLEVNYALSLGYKIIHIYEAWHWAQQEKIFQAFMQLLLRRKVMYSGYPEDIVSPVERSNYCEQVNAKLGLSGDLILEPSAIECDAEKRQYWKLLSCSVIGKLGQSNLFPLDVFIDTPNMLDEYLNDTQGTVETVDLINPSTLYLQFKPKKSTAKINRSGNCVIAAFLTAHGRINMHKAVLKVDSAGARVYSVEADAIVFSQKIGSRLPLHFGSQVGDFKQEYR